MPVCVSLSSVKRRQEGRQSGAGTGHDCWDQSVVCLVYPDKQFKLHSRNADNLNDIHVR